MRNLERFGTNMYLAMIMVTSMDGEPIEPLRLDDIMKGLGTILKERLRKGDTFCHFSPSQFALLLPTVTDETSHMVIERIKRYFYQRYPNSNVMFSYRVGPLNPGQRPTSEAESAANRKKRSTDAKSKPHSIK
jgi:GGDEF domain-containing protein